MMVLIDGPDLLIGLGWAGAVAFFVGLLVVAITGSTKNWPGDRP